ncbi:hypothetical protein SDJN03_29254, partial [Cucurbita argyrosperma subsp. sororia]
MKPHQGLVSICSGIETKKYESLKGTYQEGQNMVANQCRNGGCGTPMKLEALRTSTKTISPHQTEAVAGGGRDFHHWIQILGTKPDHLIINFPNCPTYNEFDGG